MSNLHFSVAEVLKLTDTSRSVLNNLRKKNLINLADTSRIQFEYLEVLKLALYKQLCLHFTPQASGKIFKTFTSLLKNENAVKQFLNNNFLAIKYLEGLQGYRFFDFSDYVGEDFMYKDRQIIGIEKLELCDTSSFDKVIIIDATLVYLKGIRENVDLLGKTIKGYDLKKTNSKHCLVA